MIDKDYKKPGDIIYNTKLGHLIRIFAFVLKGKTKDVMKSIKILTSIESPYEILNQETAQGKFIYKRYEKINKSYESLVGDAIKNIGKEKILVYTYSDDKMSFTGDLANELLYKFPDKVIIVGRKKNDEVRMSIRSRGIVIPPILEKSLSGLEGYGGGHEYACGANVKQDDFQEFTKRFKENIGW